jgi:protein gp37
MKAEWVRDIRRQCEEAGVAFFFKQWGAHNEMGQRVGKRRAGRLLDRRLWNGAPVITRTAANAPTPGSPRRSAVGIRPA